MTQGEIVPADIILLDSQQIDHREAITYVETQTIDQKIKCEKKKSCYLTQILNRQMVQKRLWENYKEIITGKLTYEKANGKLNDFLGYLKLSKDPKA